MSASAKSVGTALGVATVAVGALTAGTVALIKQTTAYGKEVRIASQLSGIAVEELQKMAFATSTVGIDIEKLGDISKDTREKIGDFLNTGGGGFQDFADAMKLTKAEAKLVADEFSTLSGPAILQEMVTRMEAADVSAVQMSHALEGMASDTTNLIPLLKGGGIELDKLSNAMDGVTVPLTEADLKKLEDLDEALNLAAASATNLANKTLVNLSDWFINAANAASFFFASLNEGSRADLQTSLLPVLEGITEVEEKLKTASGAEEVRLGRMLEKLLVEREEITAALAILDQKTEPPKLEKAEGGKGGGSGTADDNEKALQALQDRFKSEEELLGEKLEKELELAKGNKDLMLELEAEYLEKLAELGENNSIDAIADRFKTEEELLREKLNTELEIIGENDELRLQLLQEFEDNTALIKANAREKELAAIEKEEAKNKKASDKLEKDKKKLSKEEDKQAKDNAKRDSDMAQNAMNIASVVFEDSKAVSGTIAFMNTAEGVTAALAKYDYVGAAAIAVSGGAQIAAIMGASKGSGGGSPPSVGSAPVPEDNFEADTTGLELSSADAGGSTTQTISFATDGSDELITVIAGLLNKGMEEGRFT